MKDKFKRDITYLRVSVTDRCNLRCKYCMPPEGIEKKDHEDLLSLEEIYKIIKVSTRLGIKKIRFTGGEPLVRTGITKLIKNVSQLKGIEEITLTTNGILLPKYIKELKQAGLNRVNISLDTLRPERYRDITRCGDINKALEGIKVAQKYGMKPIKINVVLMKGFNDDEIEDFARLTIDKDVIVRFIELMPFGERYSWTKDKYLSNSRVLDKVDNLEEIDYDKGSPSRYYKIKGAKGKIGLINPISRHFCNTCNRIRLTADGNIKPCLHSDLEIDMNKYLGSDEEIYKGLLEAVNRKPSQHHINEEGYGPIKRDMNRIGGWLWLAKN